MLAAASEVAYEFDGVRWTPLQLGASSNVVAFGEGVIAAGNTELFLFTELPERPQ